MENKLTVITKDTTHHQLVNAIQIPDAVVDLVVKSRAIQSDTKWSTVKRIHTLIKQAGFKVSRTTFTKGLFGKHNINFYFTSTFPIKQDHKRTVKGGKITLGARRVEMRVKNKIFPVQRIFFFCDYQCSLYIQIRLKKSSFKKVAEIDFDSLNPLKAQFSTFDTKPSRIEAIYGIPSQINPDTGNPEWYLQAKKDYVILQLEGNKCHCSSSSKQAIDTVRRLITKKER